MCLIEVKMLRIFLIFDKKMLRIFLIFDKNIGKLINTIAYRLNLVVFAFLFIFI
jgi:hypothetical protein